MSDPGPDPRNIEDPALRAELRRALAADAAPAHLVERVRDLAARVPPRPAPRERGFGSEVLPPLLGLGLVLALLVGAARHLALPDRLVIQGPLLLGLLLPLCALALVELARGAPALRAWWR